MYFPKTPGTFAALWLHYAQLEVPGVAFVVLYVSYAWRLAAFWGHYGMIFPYSDRSRRDGTIWISRALLNKDIARSSCGSNLLAAAFEINGLLRISFGERGDRTKARISLARRPPLP